MTVDYKPKNAPWLISLNLPRSSKRGKGACFPIILSLAIFNYRYFYLHVKYPYVLSLVGT